MTTFTIITATVVRDTLVRTCRSVDEQNYTNWQHVVMVDRPEGLLTEGQRGLLARVSHSQREVRFCSQSHKECGNTCRRNAMDFARGDYVLYMDDDDYYLSGAFEEIHRGIAAMSPAPVWGVFPILRFGHVFFRIPPGHSSTCNNQFFHQPRAAGRELRYPNAGYCADGEFVDSLKRDFPYACVNPGRPLAVVEQSNLGFSMAMDRSAFESAFTDYIMHYSVETEAISLAASYYLLETLYSGKVKRVLDLGTGWSSYVSASIRRSSRRGWRSARWMKANTGWGRRRVSWRSTTWTLRNCGSGRGRVSTVATWRSWTWDGLGNATPVWRVPWDGQKACWRATTCITKDIAPSCRAPLRQEDSA